MIDAVPVSPPADKYDVMDLLVQLALSTAGADLVVEPRRNGYDASLSAGRARKVVHAGTLDEYNTLRGMLKDRARMDPMEIRIPQHGDYQLEFSGGLVKVHAMTIPGEIPGAEILHIGPRPFAQRAIARPYRIEMSDGGVMPIGEHGIFSKTTENAGRDALVLVSGGEGSGRTSRFVMPALGGVDGVDVVVTDMTGDLPTRLGDAWDAHTSRIHLDARTATGTRRATAFNPFHPDMMRAGHVDAATWVAETIIVGEGRTRAAARDVFVGAVDLLVTETDRRPDGADPEAVTTLPMVARWLSANLARSGALASELAMSPAIHARRHFEAHGAMDEEARRAVAATLREALDFVTDPGVARLLAPVEDDRGAALAHALAIRRDPSLIVVSAGAAPRRDRFAALVMQAVIDLRARQALRPTLLLVDDARAVGPMPWLSRAVAQGMPHGFSAAVVLDAPTDVDELVPAKAGAKLPGVRHWLIEEIRDAGQRARVAQAMGLRHSRISTHKADDRRLDVTIDGVRMLRR